MNYLQICQKVNTLVGMQGTLTTAENATGYQATIATIVSGAWMDIQNLRKDWSFLRDSQEFTTTQGKSEYTINDIFSTSTSPVGSWVAGMILYNKASDQVIPLRHMSHDKYIIDSISSYDQAEPSMVALDPYDQHLYINPPDDTYTLTAHYYAKPLPLTTDTQEPLAPEELHYVVVYQAAAEYAAFVGNGNLFTVHSQKASSLLGDLMRKTIRGRRIRTRGIA